MADLIDAGRSGKELNYAATDALGAITMVRLGNTTGAQFKWIRYKSGQEAATAIMGGFVDVLIRHPIDITPHVKTGQLRLLASARPLPWYQLPAVPPPTPPAYHVPAPRSPRLPPPPAPPHPPPPAPPPPPPPPP